VAKLFNDGFDKYTAAADVATGKWTTATSFTFVAGAFGGQAVNRSISGTAICLQATFETGTNETTVYGSIRHKYASGSANAALYTGITLTDGGTAQVTIMLNGDGSIAVRTGSNTGTVVGSAASAFSLNTWDSWQFKAVINNTTGSVEIRKNGSTTAALNLTSINTRGGTANNYVNGLWIVCNGQNLEQIDDFWLNSDNGSAPTTWPGDVRLLYVNTASQSGSEVFSKNPTSVTNAINSGGATLTNKAANTVWCSRPITATHSGLVTGGTLSLNAGITGNIRLGLYATDGTAFAGCPGTLMATSTTVTNPLVGTVNFTFPSPPTVVAGVSYYLAYQADVTIPTNCASGSNIFYSFAQSFGSGFPNNPSWTQSSGVLFNVNTAYLIAPANWFLVADVTNDGDTSDVFDSTVGHKDIYNIVGLGTINPASIIGCDFHVNWKKSDSGARGGTVGVDANGSGDTAITGMTNITPSLTYVSKFGWMPLDPTGAGWTTSNINAMKLSVSVAS